MTKFSLGSLVATPNALDKVPDKDIRMALLRHAKGDWGECCPEDWEENDRSAKEGDRILSAYTASNGVKFWIITEADRSATTVLLPEDY
jgi:hypothetical protein